MVSRIELANDRRVSGVYYFDHDGAVHLQKSRAVIICGYAIKTPRLLLNSACPSFENGLANSSATVGRWSKT
jgi:choline dehydrogenase-like flavoprotein